MPEQHENEQSEPIRKDDIFCFVPASVTAENLHRFQSVTARTAAAPFHPINQLTMCNIFFFKKNLFPGKQTPTAMRTARLFFMLLPGFLCCLPAFATVYNVNAAAGDDASNTSSIRYAVNQANASTGPHTINLAAGTYTLTGGQLSIGNLAGQNVTFVGAGSSTTIIKQTTGARIFLINTTGNVASVVISFSGISFQDGNANTDNYAGGAILSGGPDNVLTVTNCQFSNNTCSPSRTQVAGGAIRHNGGGTLTINQCTFTNNYCPAPNNTSNSSFGGAVSFELAFLSGTPRNCYLNVTNSVFTGNSASGPNGAGGALYINANGQSTSAPNTFQVNVSENSFINNSVSGNGRGGGIQATNNFAINDNTFQIHYNRFVGNTAATGNGLNMQNSSTENVDASNNWWGCNDGPAACSDKAVKETVTTSGGGILTVTPYLQLKLSSNNAALCAGSSTTVTAAFTNNSAGSSIDPVNLGAFTGVGATFAATGGSLSNIQSTFQSTGTATATYTAGSTPTTGTVNAVADNVPSSDATARASIIVNSIPSVTGPGSTTVCAGNTATLSATGSGSGTLSYQWYKGTTALSNSGNYSGVTTSTLTISGANASVAGTDYYVRISSSTGCGPTNSSNATVSVNSSPVVNSQPASTTLCAGTTASFSVSASGNGTFSYQWFKGATTLSNGATGSGSTVTGATTPTLTITNPGSSDAADYTVKITPSTGCAITTSNPATLTVNTLPSVTSPGSTTVCTGTIATLSATGSGSGTLSYQWYKGSTALTNAATGTGSAISGATTSTLTITNPGSNDAASNYNVRVSSSTGCTPATSTNATLTVNTLPAISSAPASTTVCAGTTATFSASGSGDGTLSYQWFKGTTALTNGATGNGSTIAGATTATLTITNPGTSDAATNYNVRISSSTGCTPATSGNVSLTVNAAPSFSAQPTVSPSSGICTGSTITLSASYSNIGSVSASSAQWFRGSSTTPLATGPTGTGSTVTNITISTTSASITIVNVGAADSLNYILKIISSTGCGGTVTSNPVSVNVSAPTIAAASTNGTKSIDATNYVITNASCTVIAKVQPAGASPISGSTSAAVTVQGSVQVYSSNGSPYAPRYYDIVPATNASTATATVTLYYNQSEFMAYNAYPGHGLNLPVDATDAANYKANIRIYQFHGTPNGSGTFPGASTETIDPADANIIYNGIYGRWEITFNVTGFSRFYLASAGSTILPLNSIVLSGHTDGSTAWLNWKVMGEKDVDHYEVERSTDGSRFTTVGQVAVGSSYAFTDQPSDKVVYYYRIKAVDKDGRMAYSSIIAISLKKGGAVVQVLPNPFREKLLLNISTTQAGTTELRLVDISGRVLVRKVVTLQAGTNAVTLNDLSSLARGTYQLQVNSNSLHETVKVMKAE